jgi:hypothetical protein
MCLTIVNGERLGRDTCRTFQNTVEANGPFDE